MEKSHILVVEDDPLISEVIEAALDDTYRITLVETAAEAMAMLQAGGVELMLLDCTLPGGLPAEVLPQADSVSVPVILMSGDRDRIDRLVDHPRPFVLKPFSIAGLLSTVGDVLTQSGAPTR